MRPLGAHRPGGWRRSASPSARRPRRARCPQSARKCFPPHLPCDAHTPSPRCRSAWRHEPAGPEHGSPWGQRVEPAVGTHRIARPASAMSSLTYLGTSAPPQRGMIALPLAQRRVWPPLRCAVRLFAHGKARPHTHLRARRSLGVKRMRVTAGLGWSVNAASLVSCQRAAWTPSTVRVAMRAPRGE